MILWRHQPPAFSIQIFDQLIIRTRFFKSWLRRIAPVTHQDQAISGLLGEGKMRNGSCSGAVVPMVEGASCCGYFLEMVRQILVVGMENFTGLVGENRIGQVSGARIF
jgi:hypothetical protein